MEAKDIILLCEKAERALKEKDFRVAEHLAFEALSVSQEQELPTAESRARFVMGYVLRRQSKFNESLQQFETALALAEKHEFQEGISDALCGLADLRGGNFYDFSRSKEYVFRAIDIIVQLQDKERLANAYRVLGDIEDSLSNNKEAILHYENAEKLYAELGMEGLAGGMLCNIGNAYDALGNKERALEYYVRALELAERAGHKEFVATITGNMGNVYHDFDNQPRALEFYEKALALNQEIGNKAGMATNYGNIANALANMENIDGALEFHFKALAVDEEIGNKVGMLRHNANIGNTYRHLENYEEAIVFCLKALAISEEVGNRFAIIILKGNIGRIYSQKKFSRYSLEKAEEYILFAKNLAEEIQAKNALSDQCHFLATLYKSAGRFEEALDYFERYHELESEVKSDFLKKEAERFAVERDVALIKREQEVLREKNAELAEMNLRLEQALEELKVIQEDLIMSERATAATNQLLSENNETLLRLNIEKNEFLGIAAHDLKNPLAAIVSSSQMIARFLERLSPEKTREKLAAIEHSAAYMRGIIVNLLDVNAIESGAFVVEENLLNMSAITGNIVEQYRERAEEKQIALYFESSEQNFGLADKNALLQVLENLISNAVKYSPIGKNVHVSVQKLG